MGKSQSKTAKESKKKSQYEVTTVATSSCPPVVSIKSVAISTPPTSATTSVATSKSPSVFTRQSVASSTLPTSATIVATSSTPPVVTSVATSSTPPVVTSVATSSTPPAATSVATSSTPPVVTSVATSSTPPAATSVATSSFPPVVTSVATSSTPPAATSVATSSFPPVVTSVATSSSTQAGTSVAINSSQTNIVATSSTPPVVTSVATSSTPPVVTSVATSSTPPAATSVATSSTPPVVTSVATSSTPPAATCVATSSTPPVVTSVATSSTPPAATSVATSSFPPVVTSVATSSSTQAGTSVAINSSQTNIVATSTPPPAVSNVAISSSQTTSVATSSPPSVVTSVATSTPQPAVSNVAISSSQTTSVATSSPPSVVTSVATSSILPAATSVATSTPQPAVSNVAISSSQTTSVATSSHPSVVTSVATSSPPSAVTSGATSSPPSVVTSVATSSPPPAVSSVATSSPPSAVTSGATSSPPPAVSNVAISSSQTTSVGTDTSGSFDPISPEETNFLRFYLLCQNLATDSVRSFFDRKVTPVDLHHHLRTYESNLRGKWRCYQQQLNVLFPDVPRLPQSTNFDFSLLYKLIRNTLPVPAPAQGWGKEPLTSDVSETDDVERVRKFRNFLAHSEQCLLTDSDFQMKWAELSQAIQRLSGGSLTTEVNDLEHKRLDQDIRSQMVVDILQFRKELKDQKARIESLEARPVPQHILKHIRDGQITQLDTWEVEDVVFYSGTAAVKEVTDKLNQHQIVTIIGGPGAGKTSIARHIALEYQKQKFEVVPICQLEDIIQFGDKSVSQVFVLDDVLGVFSFDVSFYNKLNNTKTSILSAIGKQSKLICTSRTLVYNQANKVGSFVLENVIDVDSKSNQLNISDKTNIFKNHCTNKDVREKFDNLSFENCHFMFPLLCRIFAASDKHLKNPKAFFNHPVECVKDELDKMAEFQKAQYAVLVLCMMNSKKISSMNKPLTSINKDLTNDIFDSCSDSANPTNSQINQALQHLSGTYLTKSGDHYTFIHDSIYEIVAYHFGKQHVELMIEYMSSTFVRNKLVISGAESVDQLSIEVTEDMYRILADRLLKDIKDGKLYDVFTNPTLSHRQFIDVFMDVLKKKLSYQQFKEMFLTEMKGDTDHITQQGKKIAEIKEEGTLNYDEENCQNLLLGLAWTDDDEEDDDFHYSYFIRYISFIIYYGHSYLLQCIIDYVLIEHDTLTSVIGSDLSEQSRLLTLAVYSGNVDVLQVLLKYTESNAVNVSAVGDGMDRYSNHHRKHTPLTAACHIGSMSAVKILLEMNGIVNPENEPYYTPLTVASERGHLDIVIHLVSHGGDVNLCTEYNNESHLYKAARGGHLDIVIYLVNHGGDVNLCTEYKESPLYAAAGEGHLDVVSYLVNHGGDVNLCSKYNESPLFAAAREGHLDIVSYLVNHGGDVNLCTKYTGSPMYAAAREGHLDIVSYLVEHGGDVNLCSEDNESPLYAASWTGHYDVVRFLLENGGK